MPSKVLPAGSDKIRTIVNRDQFPLPPASVSRKTPATSLPPIKTRPDPAISDPLSHHANYRVWFNIDLHIKLPEIDGRRHCPPRHTLRRPLMNRIYMRNQSRFRLLLHISKRITQPRLWTWPVPGPTPGSGAEISTLFQDDSFSR